MSKLPEQEPPPELPKPAEGTPEARGGEEGMTLWEHLDELRSRLIKMILAFVVGGIVAWTKKEWLLTIIAQPFVEAWTKGHPGKPPVLIFLSPAAQFTAYVRVAAISGAVFALPILLYQVWAFIAPGLYAKEKRYAIPFVVSSCGLFAGGSYFGWKVAFPLAFEFLLGFQEKVGDLHIEAQITIAEYLEFVTRMLVAFGLAAELPVLVFFLAVSGLVTYKHLIKFFRYFLVIDFIVAAIVTPPDMMSQLILALPLAGLYIFSIGVAWVFGRRKDRPEEPPAVA
jgi:sec-independent protein translocase protein TatC